MSILQQSRNSISLVFPGLAVAIVIAIAAQFLSDNYNVPVMLMALLLGIAFHFLAEEGQCTVGIDFAAKVVLKIGVALLGARISFDLFQALGIEVLCLLLVSMASTIGFGLLLSRFMGRGWRFGVLTAGAVSICGASAALAISSVLPKNEYSERNLLFTVVAVTILSTVAMVAYPVLSQQIGFTDLESGIFLGASIHDVAQVIGAGFTVSEMTGDTATVVKLVRVGMLAPIVLILTVVIYYAVGRENRDERKLTIVPLFLVGFIALAGLNTFELLPVIAKDALTPISHWALVIAIAAVGMRSSLKRMFEVGGQAVVLITAETILLACLVIIGLRYL